MSHPTCYAFVPNNRPGSRIVLITFRESGYHSTTLDQTDMTEEEAQDLVAYMNGKLGVPLDVSESALRASMFGWHVPAAAPAITHFSLLG